MQKRPVGKLALFFSQFRRLYYKRRQMIIRADDIPSGVYYLRKGYIRVYSLSESGEELTLIILKPGDAFPLIWAINDSLNTQYCEAMTPIELLRSPREKFLEFLNDNPDILQELTSKILVRFEGLLERMDYLVFGNAYQKVASILVICAERFGKQNNKGILIKVPLTHRDIASLIGLTRETTSLEIKKLENSKIINQKGKYLVVRDINRLKDESLWTKFV